MPGRLQSAVNCLSEGSCPHHGLETVGGGIFVCVAISQGLELSPLPQYLIPHFLIRLEDMPGLDRPAVLASDLSAPAVVVGESSLQNERRRPPVIICLHSNLIQQHFGRVSYRALEILAKLVKQVVTNWG